MRSLWGETSITLLCEGKKNIWRPFQLFFFYLPFWNFLWSVWKLPSCITWNITLAVCSSLMATSQGHTQADSRGELTTHTRRTHTHTLRGVRCSHLAMATIWKCFANSSVGARPRPEHRVPENLTSALTNGSVSWSDSNRYLGQKSTGFRRPAYPPVTCKSRRTRLTHLQRRMSFRSSCDQFVRTHLQAQQLIQHNIFFKVLFSFLHMLINAHVSPLKRTDAPR